MATSSVLFGDKIGRRMFRLLCDAAGVDHLKVRSIECLCAIKDAVTFKVETLGEPELIASALERSEQQSVIEAASL